MSCQNCIDEGWVCDCLGCETLERDPVRKAMASVPSETLRLCERWSTTLWQACKAELVRRGET